MARDEDRVAPVGNGHADEAVVCDLQVCKVPLVEGPRESVVIVAKSLPNETFGVVDVLVSIRLGGVNNVVRVGGVEENNKCCSACAVLVPLPSPMVTVAEILNSPTGAEEVKETLTKNLFSASFSNSTE